MDRLEANRSQVQDLVAGMMRRYALAGRLYDLVSLERPLYWQPRARLMELLGPMPGATVVDAGCGTGLNFPALQRVVTPGGAVVGLDTSPSMLDRSRRRIVDCGWPNVTALPGDAGDLLGALRAAGIDHGTVSAVVATFVLSLLPDEDAFWSAVAKMSSRRPVRVAVADVGPPDGASRATRPLYRALTALGGVDATRRPWTPVLDRTPDGRHEEWRGGHVHLAVGTFGPGWFRALDLRHRFRHRQRDR